MIYEDLINIGLTEKTHLMLQKFKAEGVFNDLTEGYRFGIAFAIAYGLLASEDCKFDTFLHVGSVDRDGSLRNLITVLYPDAVDRPYAFAQRLAEAGLFELARRYENDQLRFSEIYKEVFKVA